MPVFSSACFPAHPSTSIATKRSPGSGVTVSDEGTEGSYACTTTVPLELAARCPSLKKSILTLVEGDGFAVGVALPPDEPHPASASVTISAAARQRPAVRRRGRPLWSSPSSTCKQPSTLMDGPTGSAG